MREVKQKKNPFAQNWIDKAVSFVNPVEGARRLRARAVISATSSFGGNSYAGASRSSRSLKEWLPWVKSADEDTLHDLESLRVRSRDLVRNVPLARGAINTKVTNIIGSGLKLQSHIDADFLGLTEEQASEWQRTVEREFRLWAESPNCDAERSLNFYGLQELAYRSVLESGDVFAMLPMVERPNHPYQTCVQLIEADRVSNPNRLASTLKMASGVEKDPNGAPIAYHIQTTHPGDLKQTMQWTRVPAFGTKTGRRNMLHLYHKLRPNQSRGIPDLAPVIDTLKQMGRYTDSELMAAVVTGMFAVFFKKEDQGGLVPASNEVSENGYQDFKLESGLIGELAPNESIEMIDPKRPSTSFDPFMMAIMRQIGVALELPFEVLIKHFTASYSASRAALLEAWRFFKNRRTWMAQNFCDPIYEAWLTEAVASGRIYAPGFLSGDPAIRMAYCGCEWIGPAPSQLDPLKEMKANELALNMGATSLSRVVAETNGGDWEVIHAQRKKEVAMRKEAGLDAVVPSADLPPDQNQDGGNT